MSLRDRHCGIFEKRIRNSLGVSGKACSDVSIWVGT